VLEQGSGGHVKQLCGVAVVCNSRGLWVAWGLQDAAQLVRVQLVRGWMPAGA
jgi:hypothetical protein